MSVPVDPARFRELCGHWATGVAVVTLLDSKGEPTGMTVTSFASLSLAPPLVLLAIGHDATLHPAITAPDASRFTINVLEAGQESLARRFALGLPDPDRFEGVGWRIEAEGHVVLERGLGWLGCERWRACDAGDHTIVMGQVTGGDVARSGNPLLHYRGAYQSVGA